MNYCFFSYSLIGILGVAVARIPDSELIDTMCRTLKYVLSNVLGLSVSVNWIQTQSGVKGIQLSFHYVAIP